jgi:hypothetical protein
MTLPGETVGAFGRCDDCGAMLPLRVCHSAAGYYVGTWCDACGPYSRESGYYTKKEEAEKALRTGNYAR